MGPAGSLSPGQSSTSVWVFSISCCLAVFIDTPVNSLFPATQNDLLRIQREQGHAIALLSLSPLLPNLFVSYANRAAALESTLPYHLQRVRNEEGALQDAIVVLQGGVEKLSVSVSTFNSNKIWFQIYL